VVLDESLEIHTSALPEEEFGLATEPLLDILRNSKSGLIPRHEPEAQECKMMPLNNLTFREVDPKFQLLFDKADY